MRLKWFSRKMFITFFHQIKIWREEAALIDGKRCDSLAFWDEELKILNIKSIFIKPVKLSLDSFQIRLRYTFIHIYIDVSRTIICRSFFRSWQSTKKNDGDRKTSRKPARCFCSFLSFVSYRWFWFSRFFFGRWMIVFSALTKTKRDREKKSFIALSSNSILAAATSLFSFFLFLSLSLSFFFLLWLLLWFEHWQCAIE